MFKSARTCPTISFYSDKTDGWPRVGSGLVVEDNDFSLNNCSNISYEPMNWETTSTKVEENELYAINVHQYHSMCMEDGPCFILITLERRYNKLNSTSLNSNTNFYYFNQIRMIIIYFF